MFAFPAIVAADGQQPVPSSREHASASARLRRDNIRHDAPNDPLWIT
jgi:hypothetical protein